MVIRNEGKAKYQQAERKELNCIPMEQAFPYATHGPLK